MLTPEMSGGAIQAFAASLRERRPDLADLLFNATPANIRTVNAALAEEKAAAKVAKAEEAEAKAEAKPKAKKK